MDSNAFSRPIQAGIRIFLLRPVTNRIAYPFDTFGQWFLEFLKKEVFSVLAGFFEETKASTAVGRREGWDLWGSWEVWEWVVANWLQSCTLFAVKAEVIWAGPESKLRQREKIQKTDLASENKPDALQAFEVRLSRSIVSDTNPPSSQAKFLMSDLLEVKHLKFHYGQRMAVDDLSFAICKGEFFGLLGANGAGKTTTISCISGLLSKWKGEMLLDGKTFQPSTNINDRMQLGIVPQELALYDTLTGKENLFLFAELCGVAAKDRLQQVSRMLEYAGLQDRQNDQVKQYSGGMKRRLNLVTGLIHKPKLLLLDEPTVGVDPQSRNHLFDTMLRLKSEGITVIYTTHYMEEAERLCDRIAIMNQGKIIAVGTKEELALSIGQPSAKLEQVFLELTGRSLRDEQ